MSTIMTTFRDYLLDNSTFRTDFEAAFDYAKSQNIQEFQDFEIKTFDDYLDWCESYVEWIPRENNDGKNVYHHLCTFHFVLGCPPLNKYQSPIQPNSHWTWLSQWIIDFAKAIGSFQDTPASLTTESLQTFRDSPLYNVDSDYEEPPDGWTTFNEFFARKAKPGMRDPDPDSTTELVIVHPADSVFDGPWQMDETNHVEFVKGVP